MLSLATPGGRCGGREVQTAARQSQTHKETQLSQLDETAKKMAVSFAAGLVAVGVCVPRFFL